jgi:hypothetical protein
MKSVGHRFTVGQVVRFRNRMDRPPRSAENFKITRTLPAVGGLLQYRIRNEIEPHERVATEDRLELVTPSSGSGSGGLIERVFGDS